MLWGLYKMMCVEWLTQHLIHNESKSSKLQDRFERTPNLYKGSQRTPSHFYHSTVLFLWKGWGSGVWVRQGSIGDAGHASLARNCRDFSSRMDSIMVFISLHSDFHLELLLLQAACNSTWLSVSVGNRRGCYRWGHGGAAREKFSWC